MVLSALRSPRENVTCNLQMGKLRHRYYTGSAILRDHVNSFFFFFPCEFLLEKGAQWKSHEGNENTYFDLIVSVDYSMKSMSALLCLLY